MTLLSPLVGNSASHIKNSISFASFISEQTPEDNEVLVSFDIISLFTNVLVDLVCKIAFDCLREDATLEECTLLSPDQIVLLLRFCLSAT